MFPPEAVTVFMIGAAFGLAYEGVYRWIGIKSKRSLMKADAITSLLVLIMVGYFVGRHEARLHFGDVSFHWAAFTVLAGLCIEFPLYVRFCNRFGWSPFDDKDDP